MFQVDAEASVLEERIVVKPGIVEELDDCKLSWPGYDDSLPNVSV